MNFKARTFIALVISLGVLAATLAAAAWRSAPSLGQLAFYVLLTAAVSLIKLRLPGLEGTYSLNSIFLLAGAVYFTLPEVVIAAAAGVLVQSFAGAKTRPSFLQILFNASNEVFSIAAASVTITYLIRGGLWPARPALLAAAAAIYFVLNTGLVSGILTLLQGGSFVEVNRQWYSKSFPAYLLGAAVVGTLPLNGNPVDADAFMLLVPLAYLFHFLCGISDQEQGKESCEPAHAPSVPLAAQAFTGLLAALALSFTTFAVTHIQPIQWDWFLCYLLQAVLTATWKVRLPGTSGTISVHYVVVLVAVAQAGLLEALAIAAAGPLVQSLWRPKTRPLPVQLVFNVAAMMVSTGLSFVACRTLAGPAFRDSLVVFLATVAALHFVANTVLVSVVISIVENSDVLVVWRRMYIWAFPIYAVGAGAAAIMISATRSAGWIPSLLVLPLLAMAQYCYRLHLAGHFRSARAKEPICQAV